jgi:hypothetical protein
MIVRCLPKTLLAASLLAIAWFLSFESRPVVAADKVNITLERLKQLTKEALDKGWIDYTPPSNQFDGNVLRVSDIGFLQGNEETIMSEDAYIAIFFQQVAIDLRRRYLFKLDSSRRVIEPYYQKMEKIVTQELVAMQDKTLTEEMFNAKMDELEPQIQQAFETGLTAVARSVGKQRFEFVNSGGIDAHDVKLVGPEGASIDLVPQTTAMIYKGAGAKEDELPWISYQANETVGLSGTYYCRISLNGKQQTFTKKVAKTTTALEFPKP